MLKKTIVFQDFNGETVSEEHYFHLSKAELVEMEMQQKGGMHEYLQRIVASEDGKAIIAEFKSLILKAYGKRSEDGKRFIKNQEIRDEFVSSEAYSELFMELCTDAERAADFINGIVPVGLEQDLQKLAPTSEEPLKVVTPERPRLLTFAEATAMDQDELKDGLATGQYKLS